MRILVVRLSSLGDLVHTLPVVAALRRSFPGAEIDWLVDERFRDLVDLVSVVDRALTLPRSGLRAWTGIWRIIQELRRRRYDIAIDVQGLLKSAVVARLTGSPRVIGFGAGYLREPAARWLYTELVSAAGATHVVEKNLALAAHLGSEPGEWEFPLDVRASTTLTRTRHDLGLANGEGFVLLNPCAAWPSKCWEPDRYGLLAKRLWVEHQLPSAVSWGPGEEEWARAVADSSDGAAIPTPAIRIADLVAHVRAATVVVAGDTGPLHLAAAVGTPVVGIYGPSDPERNGPWSAADQVVSAHSSCRCRLGYERTFSGGVIIRRCQQSSRCLDEVSVGDVVAGVERRLGLTATHA